MKKITLFISLIIAACFSLKAEDSFQQYVGKYKFPQGSLVTEINIILENGALKLTSTMGSTGAIEKPENDKFSLPAYNGTAVFTRNEAKKITGVKIEAKGVLMEGTKEEKDINTTSPIPIYKSTFPMKFLPVMPGMLTEETGEIPMSNQYLF